MSMSLSCLCALLKLETRRVVVEGGGESAISAWISLQDNKLDNSKVRDVEYTYVLDPLVIREAEFFFEGLMT